MIEHTGLQTTLQHLERITQNGTALYPKQLPFFDELVQAGKLEADTPIGNRHIVMGSIGGPCTRAVILDLLNNETQASSIGTKVDGLRGLVSVSIFYKPHEIDESKGVSLLGALLALRVEDQPQIHARQSPGMLHPTLARFGAQELMRWGVHPHFRETPVRFTARANVVERINSQLASIP